MDVQKLIEEILTGENLFVDTETCGLHGFPVLIQWAVDDGEIYLYDIFERTFGETLNLLETMVQRNIIGFNLTFDIFQLVKCWSIFRSVMDKYPELENELPIDHIPTLEECEEDGMEQPCFKFRKCCDLMLLAKKDRRYQQLMNRSNVTIRKIPTPLSYALAQELNERIDLPDILFARYADKERPRWVVDDIEDDIHFRNVTLRFAASSGLKALAEHALGMKPEFKFDDIEIDKSLYPCELGYAPTARATREWRRQAEAQGRDNLGARDLGLLNKEVWPDIIVKHIEHWRDQPDARQYAKYDIVYTRELWKHLESPEPGDNDSELAGCVAVVRWRGYEIDIPGIKELRASAQAVIDSAQVNVNSSKDVREYLNEVLDPVEQVIIAESTKKRNIEQIANWAMLGPEDEPNLIAAERAQHIFDVRKAFKEKQMWDKLLIAGRFHADFNVIGTKSSRMSGTGGLNAQAIGNKNFIREKFTFVRPGEVFLIGDQDAFEMRLAANIYGDDQLHHYLAPGSKKLYGVFGEKMFPHMDYDQILASKGTAKDFYIRSKAGTLAVLYAGTAYTLSQNCGCTPEDADDAMDFWAEHFPAMTEYNQGIADRFKTIQMVGAGFKWQEPDDFVESSTGFRRYFTLENMIAKELFHLAERPPKHWNDVDIKVVRRDRLQTGAGAVRSALYGASFGILNGNVRAAINHIVQSTGAVSIKETQRLVWDLQPHGINDWVVAPSNVHDEIFTPTQPQHVEKIQNVVKDYMVEFRKKFTGCKMELELAEDWSEK